MASNQKKAIDPLPPSSDAPDNNEILIDVYANHTKAKTTLFPAGGFLTVFSKFAATKKKANLKIRYLYVHGGKVGKVL